MTSPEPEPPPPPQPPPQVIVVQGPPTSAWAIAGLIFGILGLLAGWCTFGVPSIAAVICGHAALADIRPGQRSGRGMAIAALVMGYIIAVPAAMVFVARLLP